jgi:outer membrane protein OmpA-like peptidoglycan-associated protein
VLAKAPDGTLREDARVVVERLTRSELFPLLPYVFFPQESAALEETAMRRLSETETGDFDETNLPNNTLGIYADLLNVVGTRMRANPAARLTLTGCNNATGAERNNRALSQRRAEAMRDYLVSVWKIDAKRIRVIARNLPREAPNVDAVEGQEEARRVEISCDTWAVLAPVRWQSVEQSVSTPTIVLRPEIIAEAGIRRWAVRVTQGESNFASFNGEDFPQPMEWQLDTTRLPEAGRNVDIELSVEDRTGRIGTSRVVLPFETETRTTEVVEQRGNRRIDRFSLILFDFKSSVIGSDNQRILDIVNQSISPRSNVTIYGFADKTGSSEINKKLALERCEAVRNALGASIRDINVQLEAVGSDRLLFDNDLPEGRNYCRTVQIVVETGMN